MKEHILNFLNDPGQLERMYRNDKSGFRRDFMHLYPELANNPIAAYWYERLRFETDEIDWGSRTEWVMIALAVLVAGVTAKLPAIFSIDEEFFYTRNLGFIIFPALATFFAYRQKLSIGKTAFIVGSALVGLIYINAFPDNNQSDTLTLTCTHLLIYLWFILGVAFVGDKNSPSARLAYVKYSGDLVVITGLFVIAGGLLSAITIGLFSLLGMNIEEFYFQNVVICLLPAAPLLGTFLILKNPQLIGKIAPTIAGIFSPLVLVMLAVYLFAIAYSGKDPYNDREFLLFFNALLLGVMVIIFYAVAGRTNATSRMELWVLLLLSMLTIVVNGIALSAILFRIAEWGITPNRAAVLGANVLILIHLGMVTIQLYLTTFRTNDLSAVGKTLVSYLPVYLIWAVIVSFIFPFIFNFT